MYSKNIPFILTYIIKIKFEINRRYFPNNTVAKLFMMLSCAK